MSAIIGGMGLPPIISRHPLAADTLLAVSLCAGSWLWLLLEPERGVRPPDAAALALTAGANLSLALRRRLPVTTLLVSCLAAIGFHLLGYHYGLNNMGPLVALYTVVGRAPAVVTVGAGALVAAVWTYATAGPGDVELWSAAGQALMVVGCAVGAGISVTALAERNRRLADLSEQLRREQRAAARRAAGQERIRIARELHDVVAHHLAVISVQAGLGRYVVRTDPDAAHDALETIAETGREALAELRRLLTLLRAESGDGGFREDRAACGLGGLDDLVSRVRAAGVAVAVEVAGDPLPLPPGLDQCAFRVVQEALTNVMKHAAGSRARVEIAYDRAELGIRVRDDGPGAAGNGSGLGLIGMTERVKVYGGMISAGPCAGGGYEVLVAFPSPLADA